MKLEGKSFCPVELSFKYKAVITKKKISGEQPQKVWDTKTHKENSTGHNFKREGKNPEGAIEHYIK